MLVPEIGVEMLNQDIFYILRTRQIDFAKPYVFKVWQQLFSKNTFWWQLPRDGGFWQLLRKIVIN